MRTDSAKALKKNVGLIHCANNLSLLQRKITNSLLFNAYDKLQSHDEHKIAISYLGQLAGFNSRNVAYLKKQLVSLVGAVHQWNILDDKLVSDSAERSVWHASAVLASAEIDGDICTYSYSPAMRKLLFRPEIYGQIRMEIQSQFKSTYGLVLYENCARYKSIGHTGWLELGLFRRLMGVGEGKYKTFKDLNKRVIEQAVDDVNEYSPFHVEPVFKKLGRKISEIKFIIQAKNYGETINKNVNAPIKENESTGLEKMRLQFGLSSKAFDKLVKTHGVSAVEEKGSAILSTTAFKENRIKSLPSYLISALNNDYTFTTNILNARASRQDEENSRNRDMDADEYERFEANVFSTLLIENSAEKHFSPVELEAFEEYLDRTIYIDIFAREGFNNYLVVDQFRLFYKKRFPEKYIELVPAYENWIKNNRTVQDQNGFQ